MKTVYTIHRGMLCMDEDTGICLLMVTMCQACLDYCGGTGCVHVSLAYYFNIGNVEGLNACYEMLK